jgi:hypothetical protein
MVEFSDLIFSRNSQIFVAFSIPLLFGIIFGLIGTGSFLPLVASYLLIGILIIITLVVIKKEYVGMVSRNHAIAIISFIIGLLIGNAISPLGKEIQMIASVSAFLSFFIVFDLVCIYETKLIIGKGIRTAWVWGTDLFLALFSIFLGSIVFLASGAYQKGVWLVFNNFFISAFFLLGIILIYMGFRARK